MDLGLTSGVLGPALIVGGIVAGIIIYFIVKMLSERHEH